MNARSILPLLAAAAGAVAAGGAVLWPASQSNGQAENRILGCDPSGPSPQDVCSSALDLALGKAWEARALDAPGSRFQLVMAGGRFSDTRIETPIISPGSWGSEPQAAMKQWQTRVQSRLEDHKIVSDHDERVNRSDLLSLLAVCARVASEVGNGGVELVLATDGRLISLGFNAEQTVPAAKSVELRMAQAGVHIDLSAFSQVTICGLNNVNTDAASAGALVTLWRSLIVDLGGPPPTILTSCRSLATDEQRADPSPTGSP